MADAERLLPALRAMHEAIRAAVCAACARQHTEQLAAVAADEPGDTIYTIDRVSENLLVEHLADVAAHEPLVLIAEGLPPEGVVLPTGTDRAAARWRVIVDPIDGTRGLMYQKRPAWILTGVAPNRGADTRLSDITLALQTEIPLLKQHQFDVLWARRGRGVSAERVDLRGSARQPLKLCPSTADTLRHGCVSFARFFPGARDVLASIDEQMTRELLGSPQDGKALCFEDQYACTGGQLYELISGHDRMVADLRPLMRRVLAERGQPLGLCCHPYDLATVLIAEEAGVVVTDERGQALDAPLDLDTPVAWVGYANRALRSAVEPALRAALRDHGL